MPLVNGQRLQETGSYLNSVSGLAIDFVYSLALDFGLDHMQLVNCQGPKDFL